MSRCTVTCYKRDTYRYTGGGSSGFTMHYSKEQCTREALPGKEKCWQHDEDLITARYQKAHEKRMLRMERRRIAKQQERVQRRQG